MGFGPGESICTLYTEFRTKIMKLTFLQKYGKCNYAVFCFVLTFISYLHYHLHYWSSCIYSPCNISVLKVTKKNLHQFYLRFFIFKSRIAIQCSEPQSNFFWHCSMSRGKFLHGLTWILLSSNIRTFLTNTTEKEITLLIEYTQVFEWHQC